MLFLTHARQVKTHISGFDVGKAVLCNRIYPTLHKRFRAYLIIYFKFLHKQYQILVAFLY